MSRYCLAIDLKNDAALIQEYDTWHKNVWPEIINSIKDAGITQMEIYRVFNRLFMIMETSDLFSFEQKKQADDANEKVMEWESLMNKFQQIIPGTPAGEKWVLMDKIFEL